MKEQCGSRNTRCDPNGHVEWDYVCQREPGHTGLHRHVTRLLDGLKIREWGDPLQTQMQKLEAENAMLKRKVAAWERR